MRIIIFVLSLVVSGRFMFPPMRKSSTEDILFFVGCFDNTYGAYDSVAYGRDGVVFSYY